MKKILLFLLVFCFVITFTSCGGDSTTSSLDMSQSVSIEDTSSVEEKPTNLALNKRVYFSSQDVILGMFPAQAVDGDENTSWSSGTAEESIDEWIIVDLGKNYDLESVTVKWGASRAIDFAIEVSRGGVEFEELLSGKDATGSEDTVATDKTARFIRVRCSRVPLLLDTYMGATIKEIEAFGEVSADQTLGDETEKMTVTKVVVPEESDVCAMGRRYTFNELIWTGAVYEFKCTGSVAGAVIKGTAGQFEVSIDGGEFTPYTIEGTIPIEYIFAEDLDETKEHIVRIMKTGDAMHPSFTVEGVLVEDTADIVKGYSPEHDLKIEFVGDSLTSGETTPMYSYGYPYIIADTLNAEFNVVSRGGMGLYRHVQFGEQPPLAVFYAGTVVKTKDYTYDFDADLVVLNIGTNDGTNSGLCETDEERLEYRKAFEQKYVEMLETIHMANPRAAILCTGGLMGEINGLKPYIESAVNTYKEQNPDVNVRLEFLPLSTDRCAETNWHPGIEGHRTAAELLLPYIKEMLNIE